MISTFFSDQDRLKKKKTMLYVSTQKKNAYISFVTSHRRILYFDLFILANLPHKYFIVQYYNKYFLYRPSIQNL